jgi:predicted PurR-regulated permease PerM
MDENATQKIVFGVLLLLVTATFIWLIRGFLQPIFWAVALGIVFFPIHESIRRKIGNRPAAAAGISVFLVILIVVLPLASVATAVTTQAAGLYTSLTTDEIRVSEALEWAKEQLPVVIEALESIGVDLDRAQEQVSSSALQISQFMASQALAIGQNTLRITVFFILMVYLLFFFLRDGPAMLEGLIRALPLGDERERHFLDRFAQVSRATIKGTLVVGVVQGTIGGILFAVLGIGAPVLWGVVMALLSILPAAGPAIVWLPAAIILIANGSVASGIILIIIGSLVIGLVDNVLRPILVGRDTKMPDYLILLSTLGGLTAFGLAGIVIGPIIAAFFISVWKMAEEEYGDGDKA